MQNKSSGEKRSCKCINQKNRNAVAQSLDKKPSSSFISIENNPDAGGKTVMLSRHMNNSKQLVEANPFHPALSCKQPGRPAKQTAAGSFYETKGYFKHGILKVNL
jgi:Cu/Zn superoxide dismutase